MILYSRLNSSRCSAIIFLIFSIFVIMPHFITRFCLNCNIANLIPFYHNKYRVSCIVSRQSLTLSETRGPDPFYLSFEILRIFRSFAVVYNSTPVSLKSLSLLQIGIFSFIARASNSVSSSSLPESLFASLKRNSL
jgi:hypothetical protein